MNRDKENDSEKWESICMRCGRCCYEKVDYEGQIYYTEEPCEYLDPETKLCQVYSERDVKRPGCVRLNNEILKKGVMPADCPYVADIDDYTAPSLLDDSDSDDF
jgi:uncharacterized cysteine cluster protein YcgN (CxxCxxCC family)